MASDLNINANSPKAASDVNTNVNSPHAASDLITNANSQNAASDLTITNNSNANAELPNNPDTYTTWCHTDGLLRFTTSVGPSMLSPLTHGASATNGVVITRRNDSTPDNREPLINHTIPRHNNNYPNSWELSINKSLSQCNDNYPNNREL